MGVYNLTERGNFMHREYFDTVSMFDNSGDMIPFGWSKEPVFFYNKLNASASALRVKETDTYCIRNSHLLMTISIANLGLYGVVSGTIIDFDSFRMGKKVVKKMFPFIKFKMPESSLSGDVAYNDSQIGMKFSKAGTKRYLKCDFLNFFNNKNLYFNIEIDEENAESMNVALPFDNSKTSYFTKRFLPQMRARGIVRFGGNEYNLDKEYTTAYLNWNRISAPNKVYYHELIAEGQFKNSTMTVHFGGGLSDKSEGIENCLFIDKKLIKLGPVKAKGHANDLRSLWKFHDKDENIYIEFVPCTKGGGELHTKNDKKNIIYGNIYGHIIGNDNSVMKIDGFDALMINTTL